MSTLLEKAKAISPYKYDPLEHSPESPKTKEEFELLEAYLKGEITTRQAVSALGFKNSGNLTHWLGKELKYLYKAGKINF